MKHYMRLHSENFKKKLDLLPLTKLSPIAILSGSTGMKQLAIYLQEASKDDIVFDIDLDVKFDSR